MAIVRAVKSGNWSDTTVWNTGALPTADDDVYSNTFTVTIDVSPTVLSISNAAATGVTAGGSFVPTNGITLTCTGAGVVAGGVTCFVSPLAAGLSCTIVGNCTGGSGNNSFGANNASTGTLNITGNCTGGSAASSFGANNASTGTLNITGNCTGGSVASANGANNASTGTLNITGNCTGGSVANANGANNASTGTLVHVGTAQASTASPAISGPNVGQVTILTGPLISTDGSSGTAAASGVNPVTCVRWFPANTALSTFEYRMRGATVSGSPSVRPARQLFLTDAYAATYPAAGNVRSSTTYGPGDIYTGTCAVPPAGSVALGVPVDATTGTAAIDGASIRSALGMASANLDAQLSGIAASSAPSAAAIRAEMDSNSTKLANLDATVSSRLSASGYTAPPSAGDIATAVWAAATRTLTTAIDNSATIAAAVWAAATRTITGGTVDTLTNAPTVPSAAQIASQVRTELATELARLDAAVSTRLATSGYTAPATAATIASTVNSTLDRTGFSLTEAERTAISTAVQAGILNESDGQAILNAIVGAIGSTNVDQVALVAAIRADLERTGGKIDTRLAASSYSTPPTAAANASAVWAASSRTVTGGTVDNVTNSTPIDAEEIAEAVRAELTPELERVANCATVETTGDQIAGLS